VTATAKSDAGQNDGARCRRSRSGPANRFANETRQDEGDVAGDRRRSYALRPAQRRCTGTPETRKTVVVLLITQRSQVQILPPLPSKRLSRDDLESRFHCPCDQLCDQRARKSASSVPIARL
jgi:hypothetical protein